MQAQLFAGSQQRQAPFAVFVFFTIVEAHVIDGQKAGDFEDRPSGAEGIRRWVVMVTPAAISTVMLSKTAGAIWLAIKRFQIKSYKRD